MKIVFDLDFFEASQLLKCCRLGSLVIGVTHSNPLRHLGGVIEDLSEVVEEMAERDSSIGDTGPHEPRTKKQVYIGEDD